jgi:hypothetical protein
MSEMHLLATVLEFGTINPSGDDKSDEPKHQQTVNLPIRLKDLIQSYTLETFLV